MVDVEIRIFPGVDFRLVELQRVKGKVEFQFASRSAFAGVHQTICSLTLSRPLLYFSMMISRSSLSSMIVVVLIALTEGGEGDGFDGAGGGSVAIIISHSTHTHRRIHTHNSS